jgi:ATP phosphoribosyltransferase regulatory subunit
MTIAPGLLPEGLRDRLPPQAEAASRLMHRVIVAIGRHGYERVLPPLAEFEENLVGRLKSSRAQDLLRIVDPVSQRMLALRPDITGQVGRIATTRLAHAPRPLRLAYAGSVIKLRATQLRPERELMQAGAELIGRDTVAAAIEVVQVALDALAAAGVRDVTVDLTLPDLLDVLGGSIPPDRMATIRALLDAKDAGGLQAAGAGDLLPLLLAAGPVEPALSHLRALDRTGRLATRLDGVAAVAGAIGDRTTVTLDPTERHGFEYQSWFGFSLFGHGPDGRALSGEIGRGGTYAVLRNDGTEEPAVGFSLYLDPLVDAGLGVERGQRLFLPLGHDPAEAARLRGEGWITVAALDEQDRPNGCTHRLDAAGVSALHPP